MSETKIETTVEAAASIDQLEKICSEPGFVMEQLKRKATVTQATIAYNENLKAELEQIKSNQAAELEKARSEAAEQARAEAEDLAKKATGVKPITSVAGDMDETSSLGFDDVVATYEEKLEKQMSRTSRIPEDERRMKAIASIARSNPQLHHAYLAQTNNTPKLKRLLAEKYSG